MTTPDFAKIDARTSWHYYEDKQQIVEGHGFKYVSEAIHHWYYTKEYSTRDIGNLLGVTGNSILSNMYRWSWPRRGQGGPRLQNTTIFTNLQYIYNSFVLWEDDPRSFYVYMSKKLGLPTVNGIRFFCSGRTFKTFKREFKELPHITHYPKTTREAGALK